MSRFTLLWPLGSGGMATVWEARQSVEGGEDIPCAIKVIRSDLRESKRTRQLFHREASINLRISHNHAGIVSGHQLFTWEGQPHLVMELVQGCNLDALADSVRLPYSTIRFVAYRALDALAYAHSCGILHRDISPDNILLSRHGDVKLSDLGLAKLLTSTKKQPSDYRGKAPYVSPEMLSGEPLDERSDLYSFGATLYDVVSGNPPFGARGDFGAVYKRLQGEVPALSDDVPHDLRDLTMGLLARQPSDRRPGSAAAARDQLRAAGEQMDTPGDLASLVSPIYARLQSERERRYGRRHKFIRPEEIDATNAVDVVQARGSKADPDTSQREDCDEDRATRTRTRSPEDQRLAGGMDHAVRQLPRVDVQRPRRLAVLVSVASISALVAVLLAWALSGDPQELRSLDAASLGDTTRGDDDAEFAPVVPPQIRVPVPRRDLPVDRVRVAPTPDRTTVTTSAPRRPPTAEEAFTPRGSWL